MPELNTAHFQAEAQVLARPTWVLREQTELETENAPLAALWGGRGIIPLPPEFIVTDEEAIEDGAYFRHIISVDAQFLPPGLTGTVGVYWNDDQEQGLVLSNASRSLHSPPDSISLYAEAKRDLPHLEALFMRGSAGLRAYFSQLLQYPQERLENNLMGFMRHETVKSLYRHLGEHHPMWAGGAAAQTGGWPWGWPDGAWNEREDDGWTLMLWTFKDSEPWYEVWWKEGQFEVVKRIT